MVVMKLLENSITMRKYFMPHLLDHKLYLVVLLVYFLSKKRCFPNL